MQRTTLVVLAVSVLALAAAGGTVAATDGAAEDEMVTIEVKVVTPGGEPVSGADVTVDWGDGAETRTTFSDGTFKQDVPAGADLELPIEHEDYVRNEPHEATGVSAGDQIEVTVHPASTLAVSVSDEEGGTIEGATVDVYRDRPASPIAEGETDADGNYTTPRLEAGGYTLRVVQPGYYAVERDVALNGSTSESVELESGRMTLDLLVQDATLDEPEPLQADVRFTQDGDHVKTVTTNEDGERSVSLDVNTRYEIFGERDGFKRTRLAITTGESDTERVLNMSREPAISIEPAQSRVVVGETLVVEVRDEYDRPQAGATVTVDGEDRAETDEEGEARVEIDTDGEVEVAAEFDGLTTDAVTVEGVSSSEAPAEDGDGNETDGDDGSPGFGVVAAALGALLGAALLARRD